MISSEVLESRFPVGSSARIIEGLFTSARATATVAELVKLGIAANRLEAEGYGPQHPIANNATEDGRAKNRRVSVRVTEK